MRTFWKAVEIGGVVVLPLISLIGSLAMVPDREVMVVTAAFAMVGNIVMLIAGGAVLESPEKQGYSQYLAVINIGILVLVRRYILIQIGNVVAFLDSLVRGVQSSTGDAISFMAVVTILIGITLFIVTAMRRDLGKR